MNLIDRDKLIAEIKKDKNINIIGEIMINRINKQPIVNQWISVEEHCPTESCLLQFEDGSMAVGYYDREWECWGVSITGKVHIVLHEEEKKPIKWQPLPPKYEE